MSGRVYRVPSEPFPDRLNAHMARVLEYWREKCTNSVPGPFPSLNDLNLMDLHETAGHLLLCDGVSVCVSMNVKGISRARTEPWSR